MVGHQEGNGLGCVAVGQVTRRRTSKSGPWSRLTEGRTRLFCRLLELTWQCWDMSSWGRPEEFRAPSAPAGTRGLPDIASGEPAESAEVLKPAPLAGYGSKVAAPGPQHPGQALSLGRCHMLLRNMMRIDCGQMKIVKNFLCSIKSIPLLLQEMTVEP